MNGKTGGFNKTVIVRFSLSDDWEKYVILWRRKDDVVEAKIKFSSNRECLEPGSEFEFDRKSFEECVSKYKELGKNKPEDEAVRDFVFYGKCLAKK
ncbi:MAG: hypothetical protein JHC26_05150 [Thermofilum sp.]|uniref:hypothetical protein n=1 Tax=Thermofilum sp. TaxID=1961369 RepID=UPI0025873808|nr:hypothetical protein [Thermofilum sp.]MCI4408457.1 hypothetical protein [Thermofilum sp.]